MKVLSRRYRVRDRVSSDDLWQKKVVQDAASVMVRSDGPPKVVYSQYLTYVDGTSNKFHMFLVFEYKENGGTMYVGLNAYGPIGVRMTFFEIARGSSRASVVSAVVAKENIKRRKGYE